MKNILLYILVVSSLSNAYDYSSNQVKVTIEDVNFVKVYGETLTEETISRGRLNIEFNPGYGLIRYQPITLDVPAEYNVIEYELYSDSSYVIRAANKKEDNSLMCNLFLKSSDVKCYVLNDLDWFGIYEKNNN